MRMLVVALAVMLLGGCAKSMPEMRESGAEATLYSSRSVDEISKCIVFAWQDVRALGGEHVEVFMLPSKSGGSTVYTWRNMFMADVDPSDGSTRVQYFHAGAGWLSRDLLKGVKSCL